MTVRADLLAALDEITDGDHARRDALIDDTMHQYFAERKVEAPDWHLPLVQKALTSLDRGEVVERNMSEIVDTTNGE